MSEKKPDPAEEYISRWEKNYGEMPRCAYCGRRMPYARPNKRTCSNRCRQGVYRARKLLFGQ